MFSSLTRKARQVAADPVLRRWMLARLTGNGNVIAPAWQGAPVPPAISGMQAGRPTDAGTAFDRGTFDEPRDSVTIRLASVDLTLSHEDIPGLFETAFGDLEDYLALHRFAWLPVCDPPADWVAALWTEWRSRFGASQDGWAWHAYTATERAVNIIDFASRQGAPEDPESFTALLHDHGTAILGNLEYFGETNTYNHLANNGRGLFRIGLATGDGAMADIGAAILVSEAERIFLASGMLREGSSHYQLLLTRNYLDCLLAARRHGHGAAETLETITVRALSAARLFAMGGDDPDLAPMPVIGDISPDCPPSFLAGLLPDRDVMGGWTGLLSPEERAQAKALRDGAPDPDPALLEADGWWRHVTAPWNLLIRAEPKGWPFYPGHAHQDLGGFELHCDGEAVFIDPGRGAYGEVGEAAFFRSGQAHNSLLIDDLDPYPVNRPYYSEDFRAQVISHDPTLSYIDGDIELMHHGYTRLGSVGAVRRRWRFDGNALEIEDNLAGKGSRMTVRRLHTPLDAVTDGSDVILTGRRNRYRLVCDAAPEIANCPLWTAYGKARQGSVIELRQRRTLPAALALRLEIV